MGRRGAGLEGGAGLRQPPPALRYRIRPSVIHSPFVPCSSGKVVSDWSDPSAAVIDPNQLRWNPMPMPDAAGERVDFLDGLVTMCGHGDVMGKTGCAIHMFAFNCSMGDKCFTNSDGDLLIVAQVCVCSCVCVCAGGGG